MAITVCTYGVYAWLVAPQIEGTPQLSIASPIPFEPRPAMEIVGELKHLFPDDAWEVQPCKIIETKRGKILFKEFQKQADGSVELTPLSMVLHPDGKSDSPPIVLRAPEGAVLKFERPLTFSGDLGQLERGQLRGEVQIYRPTSGGPRDDAFSLVTQNVQMSAERIFSLYTSEFRFGKSHGRGKNLIVDLATGPAAGGKATFAGIQRIEMAHIDHLYLHRERNAKTTVGRNHDLVGDTNRSLNIACQGPFVFDFVTKVASFRKSVLVQAADSPGDQLQCEVLSCVFAADGDPQTGESSPGSSTRVSKLIAEGTPAVLTSSTENAQATADRLEYDLDQNHVILSSESRVMLTRGDQRIDAREIQYSFHPDGRLGKAIMLGPGLFRQEPDGNRDGFSCQWQDKLTLQEDQGRKVISFDHALVVMNDTELRTQQLHLWLWELPKTQPAVAGKTGKTGWRYAPAKMLASGQVNIKSPTLSGDCAEAAAFWPEPGDRQAAWASRGVILVQHRISHPNTSPQSNTTELNGSWRGVAGTPVRAAPIQPGGPGQWVGVTARPNVYVAQVPDPASAAPVHQTSEQSLVPGQSSGPLPQPVNRGASPAKQVKFVGQQVQLQMQGGSDYGAIDELDVSGDVVIRQFESNPIDALPTLEIRGDKLWAKSISEDLYRLYVSGEQPDLASVAARGLMLNGPEIHLDQSANRLWIEGPGEMHLDSAADSRQGNMPRLGPGGKTKIHWHGGMVFDGHQIYFETAVKTHSRQQDQEDQTITITTAECTAVSVTLNREIDFKKSTEKLDQSEFEIDHIVMVGALDSGEVAFPKTFQQNGRSEIFLVSSKYDAQGSLFSNQEIRARRAEFDVQSQLANCQGPGSLTIRQLAGSSSSKSGPALISQSSKPGAPIDYVKVLFDDSLGGNLASKQLVFTGNVRSHYDGIAQWNQTPPEGAFLRTDGRGMILDCDQLNIAQWTPRSSSEPIVEMIATGNARVKGDQFRGTAERISYNESTGRVVIEAPVRANAELWFNRGSQGNRGHLVAKKIIYKLADGTFEVQNSQQIDYSQDKPLFKSRSR